MDEQKKLFVAYFYCNGADLSLGVSVNFDRPNMEIHVPFGFFRVGWEYERNVILSSRAGRKNNNRFLYRSWGYRA